MGDSTTTPGTAATGGPQGRPSLGMQIDQTGTNDDEQVDPFALVVEETLPEIAPKKSQSRKPENQRKIR